jgi:hypothetical protein
LCQHLISGKASQGAWSKVMAVVTDLEDQDPEGVRIQVCNYMAASLKKAKSDKEACFILSILDAFAVPYNPAERSAPLLISIGRVVFSAQ